MTTKPHPTDAMEMPPHDGPDVRVYVEETLRAFAIKAYDLGWQKALEEQKPMAWAGNYIDREGEHDVYVTTGEKP